VSDLALTLSSTSGIVADEVLLIDTERMLVTDVVSGTVVNVRRAWDGTPLAAHSPAATVYRQLTLTVTRGAAGTTAATHSASAPVFRWLPPSLVNALTVAYAMDRVLSETAGYALTRRQGDTERTVSGTSLAAIEKRVFAAYGRMARTRAV
jgi:hypothetical protein